MVFQKHILLILIKKYIGPLKEKNFSEIIKLANEIN